MATTQPVVPVSNEINCVSSGCHSSELAILNQHDGEGGFDPNNKPILCASCHASNALGLAGNPSLPSLSEAIHKKHGEFTNDCYKCHPGPNTQCLRGVMKTEHDFECQTCHGSVTQVGESISSGREPWFEEPACGAVACHGADFAEEPGKLYRESKGHGGLFCSACHGEPHAILPSGNSRDNVQNISLQGYAGTLNNCVTCHGYTPTGAGPHGITATVACCENPGELNNDGQINILDIVFLITHLYKSGPAPECLNEADVDNNCDLNILDIVYLINYKYKSGPEPACGCVQ